MVVFDLAIVWFGYGVKPVPNQIWPAVATPNRKQQQEVIAISIYKSSNSRWLLNIERISRCYRTYPRNVSNDFKRDDFGWLWSTLAPFVSSSYVTSKQMSKKLTQTKLILLLLNQLYSKKIKVVKYDRYIGYTFEQMCNSLHICGLNCCLY